ncbi:MAG: glycosyltransferase family 2 protein [Caldilineaceae bacterium]
MSDQNYLFSVIICTYNRAALLQRALETLCHQTLSMTEYEVIVVDNRSTDETAKIVEDFRQRLQNLRYCFETEQGISQARNHGWCMAQGDYVAFTDDDSQLPAQWLATAQQIIQRYAPAAFGGPYFACYDGPKPLWFKDSYGSTKLGDQPRILTNGYLPGPNLFFRRDLLSITGGFDPTLGIVGKQLGYGEEGALLQVVRERCPQELIYYDPNLYVYHLARPDKMRVGWQLRRQFVNGRYSYRVQKSALLPLLRLGQQGWRLAKMLLRLLSSHPLWLLHRDRSQYPYYQHYLIERVGPDLRKLGAMVEQLQQTLTRQQTRDGAQ